MTDKSKNQQKAEKVAKELFSNMKPEEMPSAEVLLRALQVAKGSKVGLSAAAVKRLLEGMKNQSVSKADLCSWPVNDYVCNPCDWKDVCLMCDWEDVCNTCDAFDCYPGFSSDVGN